MRVERETSVQVFLPALYKAETGIAEGLRALLDDGARSLPGADAACEELERRTGISLAEAINTLKLRYTIGDRWTLKTESGKARSADVVYTIQK